MPVSGFSLVGVSALSCLQCLNTAKISESVVEENEGSTV